MMKTKNKGIVAAAALVILVLLSGCAGIGVSKWKPYVGAWAVPDKPTMQLEITPNGEGFLLRIYSHNFFGVNGGVIKAHGSSDARAFKNAIHQAMNYTERGVVTQIEHSLAELKNRMPRDGQ